MSAQQSYVENRFLNFFIDSLISTLFENVQFILESTEKGERK